MATAVYLAVFRKIAKLRQLPIFHPACRANAYMLRSADGVCTQLPNAVRKHMAHIPSDADLIEAPFWHTQLALFVDFCLGRLSDDASADTSNLLAIAEVALWCGATDVMIAMRDDILAAAAKNELTNAISPKLKKMYEGLL